MVLNTTKREINRRRTDQRELVLAAVCNGNHLSAREIFERVSRDKPMSFGTVYRNLRTLEEDGEITAIQTDPNVFRYDRRRDRHHHLHCKKCGRVFDMPVPYRGELDAEAGEKSGFAVESHTISFEGLCRDCQGEPAHPEAPPAADGPACKR